MTERYLVTGDAQGLLYVWDLNSKEQEVLPLKTFEIHKEKGQINNLVSLTRPLSLFGLTANMKSYEPGEMKSLQKVLASEEIETNQQAMLQPCEELDSKFDMAFDLADLMQADYIGQMAAELGHNNIPNHPAKSLVSQIKPTGSGDQLHQL